MLDTNMKTPVSYTHLDVYKRQRQMIPWSAFSAVDLRSSSIKAKRVAIRSAAVSYTHLDVYKRQPPAGRAR